MKNHARTRGAIWAGGVVLGLTLVLGPAATRVGSSRLARDAAPAARPVPAAIRDLALACLGAGECRPPIGELDDEELEDILQLLERLLQAYGQRDFDSFLALRAGDLEHAERTQRELHDELRQLCTDLGVPRDALPADWAGLLEVYWNAYYFEAPVARFLPEGTRVALHRDGLGTGFLADWERDFESLAAVRPGFHLWHRGMIPHRRSIEEVARDSGRLRWLDLELAFIGHDGADGRLFTRFVWDACAEEWFLHRAITVLDGELRDDRRHLVL